jgi:hypothetical protein
MDLAAPLSSNAAAAPASVQAPDSSAVFARREPGSGVMPVSASTSTPTPTPASDEGDEPDTSEYARLTAPHAFAERPTAPVVLDPALIAAPISAPAPDDVEEPGAPTTNAPVVRAEPSVVPEPEARALRAPRLVVFALFALAVVALVVWRWRHF